jgi:hypothetical protein
MLPQHPIEMEFDYWWQVEPFSFTPQEFQKIFQVFTSFLTFQRIYLMKKNLLLE